MKGSLALLLSLILLALGTGITAAGQTATQQKPAASAPARPLPAAGITQQIAMAEERLRASLVEGNVDHLEDATADLFAGTLPSGTVFDKKQLLAVHRDGALKYQSIKLTNMQVRVITPVVAVVTARAAVNGSHEGADIGGDYQYTRIWVRLSARWQQVAWQAVKIP